jgi:hypothetical protein
MNVRPAAAIVVGFIILSGTACGSPGWTNSSKSGYQRWQDLRECQREASILSTGPSVQSDFEPALEHCMVSQGYTRAENSADKIQ